MRHTGTLGRFPSFIQLTERTLTDERPLFQNLDADGPHAAQFDLLEYADIDCASATLSARPAVPPASPCRCTPTSIHAHHRHPHRVSRRATGILLAHLLADDIHQPTAHHTGHWDTTPPARHALP